MRATAPRGRTHTSERRSTASCACETWRVTLAILDVLGDPCVAFRSIGSAGQPLSAQVFSGRCRIGDNRDEKLWARVISGHKSVQLGFYVPEAGPFPPSDLLSTWAEVSLAKAELTASRPGPYGVDGADIQLVDDDKDRGLQWPYLSFTAYGGEPMVISYRMTVTQPAD